MVEGRSKQVFKTWLSDRPQAWRDGVDVVAMDGFTGFKTATHEELPDAVPVMDPSTSSASPVRRWMSVGVECSRPSTVTAAARATRPTPHGGHCTPAPT